MPLTPEQIKALLAVAIAKKARGRGKSGKEVDTSVRDYQTWFKLAQELYNKESEEHELLSCENPDCPDPIRMVSRVNGAYMCRICFLSGWLTIDPNQLIMDGRDA